MARLHLHTTGWVNMLPENKPVAKRAAARDARPDPVITPSTTWAADLRADQARNEQYLRDFKEAMQIEQLESRELPAISAQRTRPRYSPIMAAWRVTTQH
jgi:hypothetical protein